MWELDESAPVLNGIIGTRRRLSLIFLELLFATSPQLNLPEVNPSGFKAG